MKFNFNTKIEKTEWLVEGLIPMGQLAFVLAQAGVGKSLFVEDLAVHIVHGVPFAGFKTVSGDVLIIDQDTPDTILYSRLVKFAKGIEGEPKHNLFIESMKGYNLSDRTIMPVIRSFPTAVMVVIDSLHSICGKCNPNYTSDMNILAKLKKECLSEGRSILINHHISEKTPFTVDQLMNDNTHTMAMGNSAILQQADTYYIIGASAENGSMDKMFIRPVAKRVAIGSKPLVFQIVHPSEDSERFEFAGKYEPELSDCEKDCLTFFREQPSDRTVKETYEGMGHQHGEQAIRTALSSLASKGLMVLSRHKSNLFKYKLP